MGVGADIHAAVGPLDEVALGHIRDEFTQLDGLVEDAEFDSLLDPRTLVV